MKKRNRLKGLKLKQCTETKARAKSTVKPLCDLSSYALNALLR